MKKTRIIRFCVCHVAALLVILFLVYVYKCPFYYFFHFPCPGCGITRAYLAAFRFDFVSAFRYHPLFFTVAPIVLYSAHRNVLRKRLNDKAETAVLCVTSVLFAAAYIIQVARLVSQLTKVV